jgi:hypothetical protein
MDQDALLASFRLQAGGCRLFDSPLYASLCDRAQDDIRAGGPLARLLAGWQGDPLHAFLPLRVLGAVHERVLNGEAPGLARYFPTAGGVADADAAWPAFARVLDEQREALLPRLENFPQTNEVRRCAGLLGMFLHVAKRSGLPLRLREIGCSAGLNLQWAQYGYTLGPRRWGAADAPVQITTEWTGAAADFDAPVEIESRAGCDLEPRRIESDADVRTLEAFIWADQPERLAQLRAAIALARRDPPRVERESALPWLKRELARPAEGVCRVVYHSAFWLYLQPDEQEAIRALLTEHGANATARTPLAWLRHENVGNIAEIELRASVWPGGEERHFGMGHPHGRRVTWF